MISTFTATTRNTSQNRLKMCEFINKYSPVCSQITLRLDTNSIIIEGVRTAELIEIHTMCKDVPAKTVIWNGGVMGSVIVTNKPNNFVWELGEIHSKSVEPKTHFGKNFGLITEEEKQKMIGYIKSEIAKKIVEENPYLTDLQKQAIENFKTNK